MTDLIYAIQVVIAVVIGLWTYDRFAKRWTSTLGDDVVPGYVNDVGYVAGEGGGSVIVSYAYSVAGTRYFGSFVPPWRHLVGFDFKMRTAELEAIFREKYPQGYEVRVFYFRDSPAEHWLDSPPSKWDVFWKAVWLPLVILALTYIPLMFINLLIYLQPR